MTTRQFNKLYLMPPNRKTRMAETMDIIFGRKEEEKRVQLDLLNREVKRSKPRREDQSFSQDWPSVWPAAQSFRSSVVPIPVRMGYRKNPEKKAPAAAYANLELAKMANFLHLTPAHVQRHCEAIKKFCTKFPEELKERECEARYFPLRYHYDTYVHQGNSIRDMRARVVTVTLRLEDLELDTHAHNKLRQLAGDRYDEQTDTVTIVADSCRSRKQNTDYAKYLITALICESRKTEPWERDMIPQLLAWRAQRRAEAEGRPESETAKDQKRGQME